MPIRQTQTPRYLACPKAECDYRASNRSGLTRHIQAMHPDRLAALIAPPPAPEYLKGVRRPRVLCAHRFPLGGDVRRWSETHGRFLIVHVRTCRICGYTQEVRVAAECTPSTCTTSARREGDRLADTG